MRVMNEYIRRTSPSAWRNMLAPIWDRMGHKVLLASLAVCAGLVFTPATAVADNIYWTNGGNNTISFAHLDGSGGDNLNTSGATVDSPIGAAINPATGLI